MADQKRRVPGISVYPRGAKWAYLVSGEADILTGKPDRAYEGGFATEDDAWDAALQKKTELSKGTAVKPSRRTVNEFFAEWLAAIQPSVKASTHAGHRVNFEAYIKPIIGHRPLQKLDVPMLNAFYVRLLESGRVKPNNNLRMYKYWRAHEDKRDGRGPGPTEISKMCGTSLHAAKAAVLRYRRGRIPRDTGPGLSVGSISNVHRTLHNALGEAVAWRYIPLNPAEHARLPRAKRGKRGKGAVPTPWTVDELARWLKVALQDRFAGIWVLAATTGMRRSELAGVTRDGLHLDEGWLVIDDTRVVVDGQAIDEDGKSDDSVREISLDKFTVTALRGHVAMLDKERAIFGRRYDQRDKLTVWEDGTPLYPDTITERFNALVDRAGVRRIRLHDVRHTYATVSFDIGVDPKMVSDRIGHANLNVTQQIYAHRSNRQDQTAADVFGRLLEAAMNQLDMAATADDAGQEDELK